MLDLDALDRELLNDVAVCLAGNYAGQLGPGLPLEHLDQLDHLCHKLIAELRASRKVVEAARAWLEDFRYHGELELEHEPQAARDLVGALAELSTLNAISTEGK